MKEVAESLKYNSMTQLLDSSSADNYKQYKVTNSGKLIQLNKIYEKGTQDRLLSDRFNQAMITLAAGIKEEEIIKVYGIDAPYFYMTETLCWPIIEGMIKAELIAEPMKVNEHIRELSLKLPEQSVIQIVFRFVEQMALYYEKARIIGTLKLNTPEAYIQKYLNEFYSIDMCYRRALEAYHELITKEIPIDQALYEAKLQLDQEYAKIVNIFNLEWMSCVTEQEDGFNGLSLKRQEDFYANEYDASYKQVVIVSDALRYEVAAELMEELAKEKHVATLSAYRAMLPTETKYCKPALLPHRTLQWQGNDLLVDGKLLPGISERTAHLANYKEHAVCVNYEDVMNGDQASNRALFKRPLVYIFHNTIDEASHSQSPFEVIAACRKAIQQLAVLINRLHASWNVNYVMLTADHGFIYNDIHFEEKDKHSIKDDCIEKKTRYYLTNSQQAIDGIAKFPLQSASGMSSKEAVQIAVPLGTNRLAAPGGYNFAHGGATLQEMIIPVIHSKLRKVKKTEKVNVALMNPNLSMVSSRLKFQLIQSEAVSMNVKERTIICGVYNGDDLVTESKRVTLNSTDSINLNNRVYDITLILNKSTTSTMLQLRIYDEEDMLNPIIRETVKNNTMIEQDF
ncbi:putative cytoplasmic protein [Bacteroides graminisolvens DSM 19988 = JCM 15093]|uniref:Putative cytoplasmic protein n=2 Tax=Bacteroides graminisolvens TaxID=477666 RepID=A0A069D3C6_9BACE|nr:putative cytoplasmic protein [Bacteroides graminisolvens DSM 19988 = JCM 15093]